MKMQISKRELLQGIQYVQGVVEKRNTMPILSHILIRAEKDKVSFFATDLEMSMINTRPLQDAQPGLATISAKRLLDIVRELPEDQVEITVENPEIHWVSIRCGKSHFRIAGLPPLEFPAQPRPDEETTLPLPAATLSELIRKTVFASGENDTRYILNSTLVYVGNKLRFVAADGHRMALAEVPIPGGREDGVQVIVPKKAILEIRKLLEEGAKEGKETTPIFSISKGHVIVRYGNTIFTSRIMEGTYPEYRKIIPVDNDHKIIVPKEELQGALRRVALLAREKTNAVKFSVENGVLVLAAESPEIGEATEAVSVSGDGEALSAVFNAHSLLEILDAIDSKSAIFEFKDGMSPFILRGETRDFLTVIMPLRN